MTPRFVRVMSRPGVHEADAWKGDLHTASLPCVAESQRTRLHLRLGQSRLMAAPTFPIPKSEPPRTSNPRRFMHFFNATKKDYDHAFLYENL